MASPIPLEVWKSWDKQGHTEFLKIVKGLVPANDIPHGDLNRALYDLMWQAVRGPVKKESLHTVMGEILGLHHEVASVLLDVLNIMDHETLTDEDSGKEREPLLAVLKELEGWLGDLLMKERLEIDTLQDCGLLKTKKLFYTRFIKLKTKLFYKQQKFNLLREESEGYAKLVTELNQEPTESTTPAYLLQVVQSLIGCFNLDPNRVLDIVLESFELRPELHARLFVPLIRSYMSDSLTLCEVLGFKFSNCHADNGGATTTTTTTTTPKSLYVVAALLLQHQVIRLDDIYRWLTPHDAEMEEAAAKELTDAKEYARRLNIISTVQKSEEEIKAEAAAQDPSSSAAAAASLAQSDAEAAAFAANQKLCLLEALLTIGAWDQASALLRRHAEFSLTSQPAIGAAVCRLAHYVVDPVYRTHCRLTAKLPGKPLALAHGSATWNLPRPARTLTELRKTALPLFQSLGPHLHRDPVLVHKLVRLCGAVLHQVSPAPAADSAAVIQVPSDPNSLYFDVLTMLDVVVLPSLALMDANCCVAEEVWNVLRRLPYEHRYRLYALWKNETFQVHPLLVRRKADCFKRIKHIMKRISKENVKPTGRMLGKLSHACPGFLFDYILSQIQIYDNLIGPVVDSLKFLTNLSYDVLGYCVLEALSNPDKERTNHDGTTISMWLTSLSAFCGAIYKKYNMELTGLLQYVANQLKAQNSLDLLILQEMVHKMGGIEASEEMTNDQMEAMQGGELLRSEAAHYGQVRNTKKSSQRLKEMLIEHELAIPLCLLIAQQRNCVVYRETDSQLSHLKLVGKLYDQCQDTLVQLGTFLALNLSVDDYVRRLPPLASLLQDHHIHADVAFFLARPMFAHNINSKFDELRRQEKNSKNLLPAQKTLKYLEASRMVMSPICESVRPLCSARIWDDLSPQFFATFWSLTVNDLSVPTAAYEREVARLRLQITQLNENREMPASKRKKEQDRCLALVEKLSDEERKLKEHTERVMARLTQERDGWFLCRSAKLAKTETITQFLQLCLFPRCVFTALDALFCARFVRVMHNLKTPNFSTLICYDRIFCDITYTVTSCTENEAIRYGRFLCSMLETVMHWHSSKRIFDDECANYPGFVTKFRVGNQPSETNDHVDYENYRHVVHKWHHKIAKALVVCLESKDYVQIRNALIVLIRILPFFPVIVQLGSVIDRNVDAVRLEQKDKRQDLFALGTSYSGQLKLKKPAMIPESEFHLVNKRPTAKPAAGAAPAAAAASAAPAAAPAASAAAQPSTSADPSSADVKPHDGVNGVDKSEAPAAKDSKKELREAKERAKDKERIKDVDKPSQGSRALDGPDELNKSRDKRNKERGERRDDRDVDRSYAAKMERDDEWMERERDRDRDRDANNGSGYGNQMMDASDPDREPKRRKTEAMSVTSKSRPMSPPLSQHQPLPQPQHHAQQMQQQQHHQYLQQQHQQQQQLLQQQVSSQDSSRDRERRSDKAERKAERRHLMEVDEERSRKADRKRQEHRLLEELPPMSVDVKRRKDDDKVRSPRHQNGSPVDVNNGDNKRSHTRDSPMSREMADRSYDRSSERPTERQRRSTEAKRR